MGELITKDGRPVGQFRRGVDAKNIASILADWREERESWIARNADALERMWRADENFRSEVSFKEVTDAEMAAGGS